MAYRKYGLCCDTFMFHKGLKMTPTSKSLYAYKQTDLFYCSLPNSAFAAVCMGGQIIPYEQQMDVDSWRTAQGVVSQRFGEESKSATAAYPVRHGPMFRLPIHQYGRGLGRTWEEYRGDAGDRASWLGRVLCDTEERCAQARM